MGPTRTQLDPQLSQCSSVHILCRCAIARYKYCASQTFRRTLMFIAISSPSLSCQPPWHRPVPSPRHPSLHHGEGHASTFHSSPPLVEEDVSVFHSSPRRVEVDVSVFPISPAQVSESASAPRYAENAAPPAEPPALRSFGKKWMSPCGRLCLRQSTPK